MEGIDKIYCMPDNGSMYAAMANNNNAAQMMALLNNNNWSNNPFAYIMFLALFNQFGFGGRGYMNGCENGATAALQGSEILSRVNQIGTQLSDNHNSDLIMQAIQGNSGAIDQLANNINVSFRDVSAAVGNIQSALASISGNIGTSTERVINGILLGNKDLMSAIANCCCENKMGIQKMGYENQIATMNQTNVLQERLTNIANGIQQGFSSTAYESQRNTCDIINSGKDNTQRIIDTLNNHWSLETSQALQDAKFEISQLKQNQYLVNSLGGGCCCNCA